MVEGSDPDQGRCKGRARSRSDRPTWGSWGTCSPKWASRRGGVLSCRVPGGAYNPPLCLWSAG